MIEKLIVVILTILLSNGWYHGVVPKPPLTIEVFIGVAITLVILWRYLPQMVYTVIRAPFLSLLILWIGLSIFWSFSLEHSGERVLWVVTTGIWGLYIGMRFSLEEQQDLFIWVIVTSLFFSLIAIPFIPDAVIHTADTVHAGRWHGIFFHKNQFGVFMALGFGQLSILGRRWGWWRWPIMALLLLAVVQSGSATALLLSVLPVALSPLFRILRLRHEVVVGSFLILIPIVLITGLLLLLNIETILVALGRSPTLTGRTVLWELSLEMFLQRPLFGWGIYGAFAPGAPLMNMLTWEAPYAHNHWIDLALNLGVVGVVLYSASVFVSLLQALRYANRQKTPESRYPLLLLLQLNFAIMSMHDLTSMADLMWISFVAVLFGLALSDLPAEQMPFRRRKKMPQTPKKPSIRRRTT